MSTSLQAGSRREEKRALGLLLISVEAGKTKGERTRFFLEERERWAP